MKFDPSDTPNAPGDAGGEDLEALRDLVKATRRGGPSPDAARRITERLITAGALDPASMSEPPRSTSKPTMRLAEGVGFYKLGAVVLAVAAGSLLVWRATWTSEAPASTPSSVAAMPAAVSTDRPATGAGEMSASDRAPAAHESKVSEVATVPIEALPSAAPKMRAPAVADSNARAAETVGANTAAPELLLVRRAQDALASDPARALALANEHAATFPRGELTQEREVVAVEALAKLGRKDDALRRANALLRRFPRTPYVAHLEKALGQPLSVPGQRGDSVNSSSKPTP